MANQLPGIRRRLVSLLYEGLVVFSILLIGFLLPQIVLSGFGWTINPRALWIHILVLLMIYFVWCWLNGGQTLPMKTWKLRIINADGSPLRPMQAVLRYLIAWPSILLFGIGIFWAMFDKDQQFLHDRLAGTMIIAAS
ncbi:MAG: hypothetical protein H6R16_2374 [Proteobacteria bacterium]|uniref:RDD protein n=1 Tax=Dechloromonas aromatica (strain RCB) TaxID=159087 RepID=Q47BH2_DECAR|nr:hypothetical protein [Pseudomonadota bacterium]